MLTQRVYVFVHTAWRRNVRTEVFVKLQGNELSAFRDGLHDQGAAVDGYEALRNVKCW